jgi:hypothetical protein
MFSVDTNLDFFNIQEIVSSKFSVIRSSVEEILNKYEVDKKLSSVWMSATYQFMTDANFKALRSSIDIIDDQNYK